MKTASVKCEAERSTFNFVVKKISEYEIAFNVGLRGFFLCLFQSNVRSISTGNLEAALRKPYGIVSGSTANIQGFTTQNRFLGHNFDKIEIGLAYVPRSVPRSVSFSETIFDCHLITPYRNNNIDLTENIQAFPSIEFK